MITAILLKIKSAILDLSSVLWLVPVSAFGQFSAGNLVVLQAGNGSSPLVNTGNPILLKEFSTNGAATFSMAVPVTVDPLIISGSASSEGGLSLSANGEYLIFGGYAQALPNSTVLGSSSASGINRGIGAVSAAGAYTRVATSTTFFSGNNIRSATSDGNTNYWAAGSNNGSNYFGLNAPAVTVQNGVSNTRCISVVNGGLYFSCGSGNFGVYRVGTTLPLTSGQSNSLVINTTTTGSGSASPYAFYFDATQSLCYVADDRNAANGGGIQKWMYSGGTWTLAYTLGTGANYGARGVVADFSGANPKVYATTSEGSSNRLIAILDVGAASTATTLATSGSNALFRGLAFSPYCSDPQIITLGSINPACTGQSVTLNASINGPGPLSYTWSGPGSFSSSVSSPVLNNPLSGTYSLTITNGCGGDTASAMITVYPLPQLAVNAPTICTGGTAVFTVTGATSYTWSTGTTGATFSVNPGATTGFTISGTSQQGCVNSATTAVQVVASLVLSVNSLTLCSGSSGILMVSGANNYTWSPGDSSSIITVTPASTTIYSVSGHSSGCAAAASATVMVTVNPLPLVTVNSTTTCAYVPAVLSASGAVTYSWDTGAATASINITPSVSSVHMVTGVSAEGCSSTAVSTITVLSLPSVSLAPVSSAMCLSESPVVLSGTPLGGIFSGTGVNGNLFDPWLAQPGTFTLTYTYMGNNGCSDSASQVVLVDLCTGNVKETLDPEIKLFSNPVMDQLQVMVYHFSLPCRIYIYNVQGQRMLLQDSHEHVMNIDVAHYPKGIYVMKIENRTSMVWAKFIKE